MTAPAVNLADLEMQRGDWVALAIAGALLGAVFLLVIEAPKHPQGSVPRKALYASAVLALAGAGALLANVAGGWITTPPESEIEYRASHVREPDGTLLKLASESGEERPESWGCEVISFDGGWRAGMRESALRRQSRWAPGEIVLRFPQDFTSGRRPAPPGWYEITWTQTRVAEDGTVREVPIESEKFYWRGSHTERASTSLALTSSAPVLLYPAHAEVH
jgi:hypothetical protein